MAIVLAVVIGIVVSILIFVLVLIGLFIGFAMTGGNLNIQSSHPGAAVWVSGSARAASSSCSRCCAAS